VKKLNPVLQTRLAKLIHSMGYEFVGYELIPQARKVIFRIYIDRDQGVASSVGVVGVTLDDCSRVSYQVSAMMDVEDPIPGKYLLEVSSPGIDRPLFKLQDYRKYIGNNVKIRLYAPLYQRRQYRGMLIRVEGENIYLWMDDMKQEITLPFSAIEKANVIGNASP